MSGGSRSTELSTMSLSVDTKTNGMQYISIITNAHITATVCQATFLIMEIIQTDFSIELSQLLRKYSKTFEADKGGIYIVDDKIGTNILIVKATTPLEDLRDKVMFITDDDINVA